MSVPVSSILADLRARGVALEADGNRLRFRPAAQPPQVLMILREHKGALLAWLAAAAATNETHADRELRRFLQVAIPRPDRRAALYDSSAITTGAAAGLSRGLSPEPPSRGGGAREPGLLPRKYAKPGGGTETFAQRAARRLAECGGLPPGARRRGAPVS